MPVWAAGFPGKVKPMRRAARHDGFFPVNLDHPDQVAEVGATIADLRQGDEPVRHRRGPPTRDRPVALCESRRDLVVGGVRPGHGDSGQRAGRPPRRSRGIVSVLDRLHRFNQRHSWSHNDHYGGWVARRATGHVLDVGCGTGNLIARLRPKATSVTGLEPEPEMARIAAERFAGDPGVTIVETTFAGRDPDRRWDTITLVAVLHHLPLVPTLRELRAALAPGGRLVVVGCHREERHRLLPVIANPVMGLIRHPTRADTPPAHMTAPVAEPRRPWLRSRPRPNGNCPVR
ncbi:hypothetical protein GCM10029964_040400 [Kibdelosporangium lantanae]